MSILMRSNGRRLELIPPACNLQNLSPNSHGGQATYVTMRRDASMKITKNPFSWRSQVKTVHCVSCTLSAMAKVNFLIPLNLKGLRPLFDGQKDIPLQEIPGMLKQGYHIQTIVNSPFSSHFHSLPFPPDPHTSCLVPIAHRPAAPLCALSPSSHS